MVDNTAEGFLAKLRPLEKIISLGLLRVKSIDQDPVEAVRLVFQLISHKR
jgi:hypothetical protein